MEHLRFLDAREQAEVAFNIEYIKKFNHGTSGHLLRILIAKLALRIEQLELQQTPHNKEYMD